MPSIRPAVAADLPALVAMRDQLNALERAGCPQASIQRLTGDEFARVWGPTLTSPHHCWRVVEHDGVPVGFGLIYLTMPQVQAGPAYIQWAFVEEAQRRHGLGQFLLDELLGWAQRQGASRVELQYIDGNDIAQRFWTKLGFEPFARRCVRYF